MQIIMMMAIIAIEVKMQISALQLVTSNLCFFGVFEAVFLAASPAFM